MESREGGGVGEGEEDKETEGEGPAQMLKERIKEWKFSVLKPHDSFG